MGKRNPVVVRLDQDDECDEIVYRGLGVVHLERMSRTEFYLGIGDVQFSIHVQKGKKRPKIVFYPYDSTSRNISIERSE